MAGTSDEQRFLGFRACSKEAFHHRPRGRDARQHAGGRAVVVVPGDCSEGRGWRRCGARDGWRRGLGSRRRHVGHGRARSGAPEATKVGARKRSAFVRFGPPV